MLAEEELRLRPTAGTWVARGLWVLIAIAMLLLFTRYRTIPDLFVLGSFAAWRLTKRLHRAWFVAVVLFGFLALEFGLPFDVSMLNRPGAPSIRTLQMGLPSKELAERAEADGIELGGCLVIGNEPRWIVVW